MSAHHTLNHDLHDGGIRRDSRRWNPDEKKMDQNVSGDTSKWKQPTEHGRTRRPYPGTHPQTPLGHTQQPRQTSSIQHRQSSSQHRSQPPSPPRKHSTYNTTAEKSRHPGWQNTRQSPTTPRDGQEEDHIQLHLQAHTKGATHLARLHIPPPRDRRVRRQRRSQDVHLRRYHRSTPTLHDSRTCLLYTSPSPRDS